MAPRILVIDDEVSILSFVSRALRAHGFQADCARDGARGLELVRAANYELVVLDLVMPRLDGIDTLKGIVAHRPQQPVLVLSALGDVESKVRCLEMGAVDYLTKPFALAELLARVRARLRSATGPVGYRYLRVGPVTLDLQRHVADSGNGP